MFAPKYYQIIYLCIVSVYTLYYNSRYITYNLNRRKETLYPTFFLAMLIVAFIGTRPADHLFADMYGYVDQWEVWAQIHYSFSIKVENILFDNLRIFMATIGLSAELFIFLIASIYFSCMAAACRKMFPNDTMLAFLVCLGAFSTFTYATNGIKAGSAASIFLLAIAYRDNLKITIPLALISWGFHHSMVMVVASYIIVLFYNKPKWYFMLWIMSVLFAALHITTFQEIFNSLADEKGQSYLEGQSYGKGFRIDFILYSAMPVLVGYYAIFKKKIQSKAYNIVLCLYLITNSIWMLCMYAEFTNRIAYLSWFQYPIVLIYPFLKEKWGNNQYKIARKVIYAHLAFTIFMEVVYYN
ncbi:MAG: EpsG family protein [Bacteroidales bacterium]|nr:EpsG family protein [Candidatus Equimonas faecalis]